MSAVPTIDRRERGMVRSRLRGIDTSSGRSLLGRDSPTRATLQGGSAVIVILTQEGREHRPRRRHHPHGDRDRGDKVRLGVELPKDGTVHRREVYEAICRVEQKSPS